VLLNFKARPAAKLLALSGKLTVQVKLAAAKQPDKKDNQGHEANNADLGARPGYSRNSVCQIYRRQQRVKNQR